MVCALHDIALHTCSHKKGSPVSSFLSSPWPVFRALREIQSCCLYFSLLWSRWLRRKWENVLRWGERMSWDCLHTGTIMSMVQNFHGHSSQDLVLALALLDGTMKMWDIYTLVTNQITRSLSLSHTHHHFPHHTWQLTSLCVPLSPDYVI